MILFWFFILVCLDSSQAQQYYDGIECASSLSYPGSRYTCNMFQNSCRTYVVYRANQQFQTIADISSLFHMDYDAMLRLNNLTSHSVVLRSGREVLIPINCSCSGQYFEASFSYLVSKIMSYSEIACGVFEGLLKSSTLAEENLAQAINMGDELRVPLKCACPDNSTSVKGVEYLVTYPFIEGDGPILLSKRFGISPEDLSFVNNLEPPNPTVFPNTTILVPLRKPPVLNFNIPDSPPPTPGFLPTVSVVKPNNSTRLRVLYIAGSVVGFSLLLLALMACVVMYRRAYKRWKIEKFHSFNARSSPLSISPVRSPLKSGLTGRSSSPMSTCLSPDILAGLKYSLFNYSIEEIRRATRDFNEENKTSARVYRGVINNAEVMIKQMTSVETSHVIDVHSKINHINILNLEGVSYGESDLSWSYLVFELPSNGCLRDCLSHTSNSLQWSQRTQIAFDIATGLHYLHCCTFPSYAHLNINSRNIFVTGNWRVKLANIGTLSALGSSENKGWVAPEYLLYGSASEKVDIFAFGVVLLELISAREDIDGKLFKESIKFLGGGSSEGGFLEQLRSFMDQQLKEYPLAEALCLAVLAKACVEDDPLHRPSIDDIIKVLARMVEPEVNRHVW
ncbi:lysM domain receptor-like kinase 4 [Argentina anserina]|uniref:lysM domain receptor-like kinase 4 n=1 Tax=Argentina anserina TaxID=57926 RepID=UPI00217659C8|nr:lysM domain receptor-like kinase 4 [Potentilla anserina]